MCRPQALGAGLIVIRLLFLLAALLLSATSGQADVEGFAQIICFAQTQEDIKATAAKLATPYRDVEIKSDPQFTERYYATLESMGDWNGKRALDYVEPYEKVKGSTAVALFVSREHGNKILHAMFINVETCERPVFRLHYQLHQEVMKRE